MSSWWELEKLDENLYVLMRRSLIHLNEVCRDFNLLQHNNSSFYIVKENTETFTSSKLVQKLGFLRGFGP